MKPGDLVVVGRAAKLYQNEWGDRAVGVLSKGSLVLLVTPSPKIEHEWWVLSGLGPGVLYTYPCVTVDLTDDEKGS